MKKRLTALSLAGMMWISAAGFAQENAGFRVRMTDNAPAAVVDALRAQQETAAPLTLVLMVDFTSNSSRALMTTVEEQVHRPLQGAGLRVVALARGMDETTARAEAAGLGLTFEVLPDADRALASAIATDGIGVPRCVMVDGDGKVRYLTQGHSDGRGAELFHVARALLDRRSSPVAERAAAASMAPPSLPAGGLRLMSANVLGDPAPEFHVDRWLTVPPADTEGKFVMTEFFATWCGPCIMVMPHLEKLHRDEAERLVLRSVSDEPVETLERFLRTREVNYPLGADLQGISKRAIGVRAIPNAYITNPAGIVVWQGHPAELNDTTVMERILSGSHRLNKDGVWVEATAPAM